MTKSLFASRLWTTAAPIAFLLVLATMCMTVFWLLLHSREVAIASKPRLLQLPDLLGHVAGDFVLPSQGRSFRLYDAREPVLLEMFATWCVHCEHEVPIMNALYRRYRGRVAFLAVTSNYSGETRRDISAFVRRYHALYPIAYDGSRRVLREFDTIGFPMYVIVGRDHRIVFQDFGEVPYSDLDQPLQAATR